MGGIGGFAPREKKSVKSHDGISEFTARLKQHAGRAVSQRRRLSGGSSERWDVVVTSAGDVVLAGRGEASAAVAVDGRHSELVPALGPQVGQDHVLGEALRRTCHNVNLEHPPLKQILILEQTYTSNYAKKKHSSVDLQKKQNN